MPVNVTSTPERLQSISVDGYVPGRNRPGNCARWNYYATPGVQPNLTPIPTAYSLWTSAPAEHRHPIPTDRPVPKGLPIILGPSTTRSDANRNAGDVFPALGQGIGLDNLLGPMTDSPRLGSGRIGTATLRERMRQSERPVLGYLTWFGGYEITSDDLRVVPIPSIDEEDVMKIITDNKTGQLLDDNGVLYRFGSADEVVVALQGGAPVQVVHPNIYARMLTRAAG